MKLKPISVMKENQMNRQEMITDFQHFLDTHKEEVEAHLAEPKEEWFEDDGWDDVKEKINS